MAMMNHPAVGDTNGVSFRAFAQGKGRPPMIAANRPHRPRGVHAHASSPSSSPHIEAAFP
jgi:hypothetical protein